jgi:Flp pilus assembly pilin Flp
MKMKKNRLTTENGQGLLEYGLILILVAVVTTAGLSLFGVSLQNAYQRLPFFQQEEENPILDLKDDFLVRIQDYYDQNNRWPRSWGDYRYTDLGLDPDDWDEPVEGIYWSPHGADVGLANRPGDEYQVYVNDLDGNQLHLYDGWNIWCVASNQICYYHSVAPENEVDINSLEVVEE